MKQTDIANAANDIDETQKDLRKQLDQLVAEGKMPTYGELHEQATKAMSDQELKDYQAVSVS